MKEVRRIKFTGKNLNDVFALPCVEKICKHASKRHPYLVLYRNMLRTKKYIVNPDDELIKYDDGTWGAVKND